MRRHWLPAIAAVVFCATFVTGAENARADEPFFAGKTVTIVIPAGPGGIYGLYAQVFAPHLSRHVPGNPNFILQYVPGSGGTKAANYIANAAPRDGTVLATPHSSLAITQVLRPDAVKYDVRRFRWIGTIGGSSNTLSVWRAAGVVTVEQATRKQIVIGATGRNAVSYMAPRLMNAVLGTKFKIVTGYKGVADLDIALERGEIQGRANNWLSWKTGKPDWLRDGKIVHLVQISHHRAPDLRDVPLLVDLASNEADAQMFRFISSIGPIGRGLALPDSVPADRIALLRDAFENTLKDPAFLKDAAARQIEIDPTTGPEVEKEIARVLATPRSVVDKLRRLMAE